MRTVEKHSGICGNSACVAGTRIPVWLLEQMRRLGVSEVEILQAYPTLSSEDLVSAWSYVRLHPDEIEKEIQENEEDQ